MNEHRWAEHAAAYALGSLDPGERAEFEQHLETCASCRAEVQSFHEVTAFDLPPAPAGRTYQLWAIEKGRAPVSVGTFNPAPNGRAVITLPMPAGVKPDLSAVTDEPAGGSPQPTQQPFLVGSWQRRT